MSQHMDALQYANDIRSYRGRLKAKIASQTNGSGVKMCVRLIRHPTPEIKTMRVGQLMQSCRGWGPARSLRVFRSAGLTERTSLGDLTDRQREALIRDLSNLGAWQEYRDKIAA